MNEVNRIKLSKYLSSLPCPVCGTCHPVDVQVDGSAVYQHYCKEYESLISSSLAFEVVRADNCEENGICYEPGQRLI